MIYNLLMYKDLVSIYLNHHTKELLIAPTKQQVITTSKISENTTDKGIGLGFVVKEKPKEVTKEDIYSWFSRVTDNGKKKFLVTDQALELVNHTISSPEYDGFKFIDTMITYQNVLQGKNVTFDDYLNAIRFCAFLETCNGNATEAYMKAFVHRDIVKNAMGKDYDSPEYQCVASAASRYRKSSTVIKIIAESEVPLYLLFQGYRYKAVQVLADKMMTAKLDRDKINAADKLLFHLKPLVS